MNGMDWIWVPIAIMKFSAQEDNFTHHICNFQAPGFSAMNKYPTEVIYTLTLAVVMPGSLNSTISQL